MPVLIAPAEIPVMPEFHPEEVLAVEFPEAVPANNGLSRYVTCRNPDGCKLSCNENTYKWPGVTDEAAAAQD